MTVVYFDCFAGAAGDMILGALIDAGAPTELVQTAVERLALGDCRLDFAEVTKSGLRATKAVVTARSEPAARTLSEITAIVEGARLDGEVTQNALHVFRLLAEAEARVHGASPGHVRLHEVGMSDSIVDVVGCVVALRHFRPTQVICSELPLGTGTARGAHGALPVPAPAVLELLRGVPVRGDGSHEMVTPTGAALLVGLSQSFGSLPRVTLEAVGYGAGERETDAPNLLRVVVGTPIGPAGSGREPAAEDVLLMEANLDDLNPEMLPYALEQLLVAGAQDAWVTPVLMKKGRPGFVLTALFRAEDRDRVADVFFRETSTLGVRVHEAGKTALTREWVEVHVEGHPLRVKMARRGGSVITASPEYEDAVRVARATGLPLREVYARAQAAAQITRAPS